MTSSMLHTGTLHSNTRSDLVQVHPVDEYNKEGCLPVALFIHSADILFIAWSIQANRAFIQFL